MESAEITRVSRATDEGGRVFRYLAISSMLEKYGLAYVADVQDMIATSESQQLFESDIEADCAAAQGSQVQIREPSQQSADA